MQYSQGRLFDSGIGEIHSKCYEFFLQIFFSCIKKEMPKQWTTTTKELDQLLQLLQQAIQDKPKSVQQKKKGYSFTPQEQLSMVRIGKVKPLEKQQKKQEQKKQQQEQQLTLDQLLQYTDPSKWNKKK